MCGIDPRQQQLQAELLGVGLNLLSKLVEAELGANSARSEDVLSVATKAYQQGKITKSQYIDVINALDEQTYQTSAYAEPKNSSNREYLEAKAYLDRYRR